MKSPCSFSPAKPRRMRPTDQTNVLLVSTAYCLCLAWLALSQQVNAIGECHLSESDSFPANSRARRMMA